jgi:hypothetical protein
VCSEQVAQYAMNTYEVQAKLSALLARVISDPADIERLASAAGMNVAAIARHAKAVNYWLGVLTEAFKRQMVPALLAVCIEDVPGNQDLVLARELFDRWNTGRTFAGKQLAELTDILRGAGKPEAADRLDRLSAIHRELVGWKELHNMLHTLRAAIASFSRALDRVFHQGAPSLQDARTQFQEYWRTADLELRKLLDWFPSLRCLEGAHSFEKLSSYRDSIGAGLRDLHSETGRSQMAESRSRPVAPEDPRVEELRRLGRELEDEIDAEMSFADMKLRATADRLSLTIGLDHQ